MPDQQIIKGTVYSDGNTVNAANLNAHVDNARLAFGAITAQPAAASVTLTDELLINQNSTLKKATLTQVQAAIASDYLKKDGSVSMTTGQLNLYSTTQLADINAVSLGHLNANFVKNSGSQIMSGSLAFGTSQLVKLDTTGISMLTTAQLVTLSRDPLTALEAVPKQYVDNLLNPQQLKCKGFFTNANPLSAASAPAANKAKYLPIKITRTLGSTVATINFSTLSNEYKSAITPFFLKGQYIGLEVDPSNLLGQLYKIQSVNYTNFSLTINTPGYTTALSEKSNNLTLLYDNANNNDVNTFNCKSVYTDATSKKIYVNYWDDVVNKSKTNESPTQFFNSIVNGQATGFYSGVLASCLFNAAECVYINESDKIYLQSQNEGFGSFSTGIHMYFNYGSSGFTADNNAYIRASFAIF